VVVGVLAFVNLGWLLMVRTFCAAWAGPVSNTARMKKAIGAPSDFIEASVAVIPEY